jgi:signal transduction histidine kinase
MQRPTALPQCEAPMRLSQFILDNLESILQQWEDFARTLASGRLMSIEALRDDAERMLRFVAADIETGQSREQETAKAVGRGPGLPAGQSSAAHDHGVARAVKRFSLIELVSEYRALRAAVTRMWLDSASITADSVAQLTRFNEAIDQILAEGVSKFTERLDRDADLFAASVGHDLSNPVNAIAISVPLLSVGGNLTDDQRYAAARIERAAGRLGAMLSELRDFTRTRLGGLAHIETAARDVGALIRNVVDELAPIYGGRRIKCECKGDLVATVDAKRIAQLVSNLVANGLQHGPSDADVTVTAVGDEDSLTVEIHNAGSAIDPARMNTIFDPGSPRTTDEGHLGLGLYIAQQIVLAHDGSLGVRSTDETGTTFSVRLPRRSSRGETADAS